LSEEHYLEGKNSNEQGAVHPISSLSPVMAHWRACNTNSSSVCATREQAPQPFHLVISIASMLASRVGVWALIVVLSLMNGFQKEVRARILGVIAHVQITVRTTGSGLAGGGARASATRR